MANKTAILTINYTSKEETISLIKNLETLKGDFELFVLENGSPKNSISKSDLPYTSYKLHFYSSDKNLGYAGGNNLLIKKAREQKFDYYWLLNNDTKVESNTLDSMLKVFVVKKDAGIVGCAVIQKNNKIWWAGSEVILEKGDIYKKFYGLDYTKVPVGTYTTDEVNGAVMLIKNDVIESVGLLDTVFFHTAEDTDYSLRAKQAKFELYINTKAKVFHSIGKSSGGAYSPLHMFYVERGRLMLMRKWGKLTIKSFYFLIPLWLKRVFAPLIKKGDLKSSIYTIKGIVEGFKTPSLILLIT